MHNLITIIKKSFQSNAEEIAIVESSGKFIFRDLNETSTTIASNIISRNYIKRPIAVYLPKTYNAIASFVGIIFSGNFYVPLDTKAPINRILTIIDNLYNPVIISDTKHIKVLLKAGISAKYIINIDNLKNKPDNFKENLIKIENQIIDTDPVYIIYTSGSTGTPKGVVITHRGVIDYIQWATYTFSVGKKEQIGSQAPLYFDNSTLDVFLCLFNGATLNFIPETLFMFPVKLIEYINTHQINFVFWVPSVLQTVANLDTFKTIIPYSLQKILFAGEVMSTKHLNYWIKHMPDKLYANLYGPTEITVDCTYYIVDRKFEDNDSLPIGHACMNTEVLILDKNNQLVKKNEHGELCVRGSSLSHGYWNNLEKTNEVFVQNPLNTKYPEKIYRTGDLAYFNDHNEIIFVGRKDNQIKLNGYRIELGEIENAAMQVESVQQSCILFDDIQKKLHLVYSSNVEIQVSEIRNHMLKFVPKYMLPTNFIFLKELPLNANGKIDRILLMRQYVKR